MKWLGLKKLVTLRYYSTGWGLWESLNDILKRIKGILDANDRKRPWLAKVSGVSLHTLNGWFQNNSMPPADKLGLVARSLGVSLDFLVFGRESPIRFAHPVIGQIVEAAEDLTERQLDQIFGMIRLYQTENAESSKRPKIG